MKQLFSILLSLAFVFSLNNTSVKASSFPDLEHVPWAKEEIIYLTDEGIINGFPDGTFGPQMDVTRGQVAVMLVRDLFPNASPTSTPPFTDLSKGKYYYNEVAVAYEKGIIKGYDNKVRPTDPISRAEAAVMVDRAYDIKRNGSVNGLPDAQNISWATGSIMDLYSQNIINGTPDGSFKPYKDITRAEFAKVLAATIEPSFRSMDDLEVHFIDVGQGDSTLIESPSGKTILIDGGRKSAGEEIVDYLASSGIDSIDIMVATHPDADHIGGLIDVLEQVEVKKVVDSGKPHTTDTYMEYLTLIDQKNIPFETPSAGDSLNLDDTLDINVLNSLHSSSDNNESSIVLKVSHNQIDFMLTGDASVDIEQEIIEQYDVEAEILKLGHHGASNSTSSAFVNAVDPEVGILSYGPNSYGHPDSTVVNRMWDAGATLYSTCDAGTITVTTNGNSYHVDASPFDGSDNCGTNINPEPEPEPEPTPDPDPQYPINVNTADYETLQLIKGVGPAIAQNIIDYRNTYGPFTSYNQLLNVKYIGPATLEEMRPYITLG
ncbi:competence protein ComEA helix-hairpin-helix repeat region [Halobacillus dabanensis]|uniref:Competence protein ComEA helix-hairpin-helix repeat region n=1 Tax=Halobacillus dabanensis TaxID=240302 RepID=A0A1I3R9Q0_HALDA|nr:S-layer homology domain-containing protein [Halobacillus dabanensis]SFJ43333.1 competence protein ComEA helix-hairpin-helix repeat region [Halobacillus dabanensis]